MTDPIPRPHAGSEPLAHDAAGITTSVHAGAPAHRLLLIICLGQVGSLLPHMAYAALLPGFARLWGLHAWQSGAVAGAFYVGYAVAVPLTTTLTDRLDARKILLRGSLTSACATASFGLLADGFVSAMLLWALAGAGFAGVYMPGLRALTDRLPPGDASRSVTTYTSSYSLGVALSYLLVQLVDAAFGWRMAFIAVACGPLVMTFAALSLSPYRPESVPGARLLDFRPVLRNRAAMAYILGYGAHCFEMAALRAWLVAFWLFTIARDPAPAWISAAAVSVVATLLAVPASILGNESALRFGRTRFIATAMIATACFALALAWSAGGSWWSVLLMLLLYGAAVPADSGSLTAGMVGAAEPRLRGATMALHSTVGFGASFFGPVAMGLALDLFGGPQSPAGWQAAYGLLAMTALVGLPALGLARRDATAGR